MFRKKKIYEIIYHNPFNTGKSSNPHLKLPSSIFLIIKMLQKLNMIAFDIQAHVRKTLKPK